IDSSGDSLELIIQQDRLNGTQSVFTQHRMATHYEYNSLNQLVRQSMPDQDNMDIWQTTLPNGLDSRFKAASSQFVSATRGYLSGYIDAGSGITRGTVYITDDGGSTWKRMGGEVGADINKIQWVSTSVAYAVGDYGTVIKSSDGGNNWDMLSTWSVNLTGGALNTSNLNDLYFTDATHGVVVGDDGLMLKTTTGTSFTQIDLITGGTLMAGDDITSVTYDGTDYYITVFRPGTSSPDEGLIFKSPDLTTWTQQTNVRTIADMKKVQYYDDASAYAAGEDGTLLHTADNGASWQLVHTSVTGEFRDIFFRNENEGIAILTNSVGDGELWKTFDKGVTWTLLGNADEDYQALYPYENNSGGAKVVAVGSNGLVSRVIMTANTPFGVIPLNSPASTTFHASWATKVGSDLWLYVAGADGNVYYTKDATASYLTWVTASTGMSGEYPVKMSAMQTSSGTDPGINGTLITNTGELWSLHKVQNSSTYSFAVFSSPATGSSNFADITSAGSDSALVAFNNYDQKLYSIVLTNTAATSTASTVGSGTASYSTIVSLATDTGDAIISTSGGELEYIAYTISSPSTTFTDRTEKITSLPLHAVEAASGGNVYAVGDDGTFIEQNTSDHWRIMVSGIADNINATAFSSATVGLIAGDAGSVYNFSITGSSMIMHARTSGTTE
ncbi:MAG TPA: hypothetical protein VFU15_14670, partial [Bacteroidia bacterium]|nr:hypothetical protein [Bacteroidia bacterium]